MWIKWNEAYAIRNICVAFTFENMIINQCSFIDYYRIAHTLWTIWWNVTMILVTVSRWPQWERPSVLKMPIRGKRKAVIIIIIICSEVYIYIYNLNIFKKTGIPQWNTSSFTFVSMAAALWRHAISFMPNTTEQTIWNFATLGNNNKKKKR